VALKLRPDLIEGMKGCEKRPPANGTCYIIPCAWLEGQSRRVWSDAWLCASPGAAPLCCPPVVLPEPLSCQTLFETVHVLVFLCVLLIYPFYYQML
jgi:hypothetical protein